MAKQLQFEFGYEPTNKVAKEMVDVAHDMVKSIQFADTAIVLGATLIVMEGVMRAMDDMHGRKTAEVAAYAAADVSAKIRVTIKLVDMPQA